MLKTISLRKFIKEPKLKVKKSGRVYDKEWNMFFSSEETKKEFRERIERAEKNIEEGNYYTQKEMEEMLAQDYGIYI